MQADPPIVKTDSDAKTFTYTLRPRRHGIREMAPIELAYFDPDAQRFQVARSAPVPLRVDAASTLPVSAVIDPSGESVQSVPGQELTEGILANYDGADLLMPQDFRIPPWAAHWSAPGAAPGGLRGSAALALALASAPELSRPSAH